MAWWCSECGEERVSEPGAICIACAVAEDDSSEIKDWQDAAWPYGDEDSDPADDERRSAHGS